MDREFTDEEVRDFLNAEYGVEPSQGWHSASLAAGRKAMHRLVEAGWTPPEPPRFYVEKIRDGTQVRDREEHDRLWAAFYTPSESVNRRAAEEFAARRNREHK